MIERQVPYRLCDVPGCEDRGSKYHFPGGVCLCDEHRGQAAK